MAEENGAQQPLIPSESLYDRLVKWEKNNVIFVVIGIAATIVALVAAFLDDIETLTKWARKHYFILTTVTPFENRLNSSDVADWSSGQLHIARYRIKSYRNQIDVKGGWLDTCLSNEYAFPKHYEAQINREFRLPLSNVDEHNLGLIWKRLKQIDISRTEENRFLSISSLYDRLAERAQTQLLHLYNNEEISQFPEKDLYFLRNEIYARKGWTFSTPKLHKYFSRKGWYDHREDFSLRQLSPVEICNAFYLKERYPRKEMKSWGRAIHVGIEDNVGDYSVLIDSVHGCLSDRTQDRGMQLFLKKGIGYSEYFRGYVDLVVAVLLGQKSEVRMTLLDPKYIISKDKNGDTENGQRTIRHGLFQFAKELQNLLKEYDAIQNERIDKTEESYLGVTISLKGTLKNTVFANSGLE